MKTSIQTMTVGRRLSEGIAMALATLTLLAGCATSPPGAVFQGDIAAVRRALDGHEVKIDDRFDFGFTLLHAAAIRGDVAIAELLLERGASVNDARNEPKRTPLHLAVRNRRSAMVDWLLAHGAGDSLTARDGGGFTPLMEAVSSVQMEKVVYVTNALGHVLATPRVEDLPPDIAVVEALLRAGADPNEPRTRSGNTTLHLAAWWGHSEVVRLLLSSGADPSIANQGGQTAQQMAESAGKAESARLIAAAGRHP